MQSRVYLCQCRNNNCHFPFCDIMKRYFQHIKTCKHRPPIYSWPATQKSSVCAICKNSFLCVVSQKSVQKTNVRFLQIYGNRTRAFLEKLIIFMAGTEFEEDDPQQEQSQQQSDFKTQQKLQALKDQLTKANEHLLRIFRKASTYR